MKLITKIFPGNIKLKFKINATTDERRIKEAWVIKDYFSDGLRIQENDIVIDIGAHIGTFTVYAAKLAHKGKVYAFEPHPENFILLERNCKLNNLNNVKLFQYGVDGKKRTAKLFIDEENTGGHSIYKESQKFISIECITLKDIFDSNEIQFCNFLKLDCEGAEYDILFNTPQNYFDRIDKIALEYHDYIYKNKRRYRIIKFLSEKGFKIKIKPHMPQQEILYAKNTQNRSSLIIKFENYLNLLISLLIKNYFKVYTRIVSIKTDRTIGLVGIFLKRRLPRLYFKLKGMTKDKFGYQNEKNLLVTLADKNYVERAKQLFSSVYWNAGWKGDYMLLAHEIPQEELKWFREKGILVRECEPLEDFYLAVRIGKFYLFTPEFKKWKNIVYLDSDIIVRGPLDKLTEIKGFGAADPWNNRLFDQIVSVNLIKERGWDEEKLNKLLNELIEIYSLKERAFNSGVMAFNTDIIREDTFSELNNLFKKYGKISAGVDQVTFNLFFYKKWKKLPRIYNLYPKDIEYRCHIKPDKIKGIIIHFVVTPCFESYKPWDERSFFYKEWQDNLKKAELINLGVRPRAQKRWTETEIQLYVLYLKLKPAIFYISYHIDRLIGLMGIFLKRHYPRLYFRLKRIRNGKS